MPPRLEDRQERPYVAIAATLSIQEEPKVVPGLVSKLEAWLAEKNIEKTGPPFVRYKVTDMPADLKIEVGIPVPVGAPVVEEGRVQRSALPRGRYGILDYLGPIEGLVEANARLQRWAEAQGIVGQMSETNEGAEWTARTETLLTKPT